MTLDEASAFLLRGSAVHFDPNVVELFLKHLPRFEAQIAALGLQHQSAGNSTEPHLHFHVCSGSNSLQCNGMPVAFANVKVLWAETDRALQSGDIVIAK